MPPHTAPAGLGDRRRRRQPHRRPSASGARPSPTSPAARPRGPSRTAATTPARPAPPPSSSPRRPPPSTSTGYTGVYDAAAHGASLASATGVGGVDLSGSVTLGASFTNVPGGTAPLDLRRRYQLRQPDRHRRHRHHPGGRHRHGRPATPASTMPPRMAPAWRRRPASAAPTSPAASASAARPSPMCPAARQLELQPTPTTSARPAPRRS